MVELVVVGEDLSALVRAARRATRWGSRGLWHCGHSLYAGVATLCWARRCAVRACDCFCLGTAMGWRLAGAPLIELARESFAQRGSGCCRGGVRLPALVESTPQMAQSGAVGAAQHLAGAAPARVQSRAHAPSSSTPSVDVRRLELLPRPGLRDLTRVDFDFGVAGSRQRMHGPAGRREPQPQGVPVAGRP